MAFDLRVRGITAMNNKQKQAAALAVFVAFGILPPAVALHLSKPRLAAASAAALAS